MIEINLVGTLLACKSAAKDSLGEQVPFPSRLGEPGEFAALVRHAVENRC